MLVYIIFRFAAFVFWLCPFWLLYRLSDLLYYPMFYAVKYRKSLVISNLKRCFPELSEKELLNLTRKFYRHFCDIVVESIKGVHLSEKQALARYKVRQEPNPWQHYEQGLSCIYAGTHIGNWEWGAMGVPLQAPSEAPKIMIYKEIRNKYIDRYIRRSRMRYGSDFRPTTETSAIFKALESTPALYFFLADQWPGNREAAHKVPFFGQEVPFLHGIAKYAKRHNFPVYIVRHRRIKRGYYESWAELLVENPAEYKAEEITALYARELEVELRREPANWLWSHKRWKHLD